MFCYEQLVKQTSSLLTLNGVSVAEFTDLFTRSAPNGSSANSSVPLGASARTNWTPEGKGKQERFFETVQMQFLPEVEHSEIATFAL